MQELKLYISTCHEVAFNLALEEHLLVNGTEDYLLLYRNTDAVVIGKHQNPWKEVNLPYCEDRTIEVARRLSGGGTVYHDLDNLNFSYIRSKATDFVNFREHIVPISKALEQLGVQNRITDRNDIFIGEHKISGNAEHVNNSKKRILHHGTLLYSSDLDKLRRAIHSEVEGIKTHAVDSVRSSVTTINHHTVFNTVELFQEALIHELMKLLPIEAKEHIAPKEIEEVQELVLGKYTQWEWTKGHTPQFEYTTREGDEVMVRKGLIKELKLANQQESSAAFEDKPFKKSSLKMLLQAELHPIIEQICID